MEKSKRVDAQGRMAGIAVIAAGCMWGGMGLWVRRILQTMTKQKNHSTFISVCRMCLSDRRVTRRADSQYSRDSDRTWQWLCIKKRTIYF